MTELSYLAAHARQSAEHDVLTFAATADEVLRFAQVERVARDDEGRLTGFQRTQIAPHIREIKDYLDQPDSVLPNAVVVAFTGSVSVEKVGDGISRLTIDLTNGAPGLVVDGQQRLTALSLSERRADFQVFVSVLICRDEAELRRQFVLINNTRPLPKSLIYELLPSVGSLPDRMEVRARASELTSRLNYDKDSALFNLIRQHTYPTGIITDTAVQRVIMNSLTDGAMRELIAQPNGETKCARLISEFFWAVRAAFPQDWIGHKPTTSRLLHGAGIQAMGYVMDHLAEATDARTHAEFLSGLRPLQGRTAWSSGSWTIDGDVRTWRSIQNVSGHVSALSRHLIGLLRAAAREGGPTSRVA